MNSFTVSKVLIELTDKVIVDPIEVSSIQEEIVNEYSSGSPSDNSMTCTFSGSVVTLKNGRKIYIKGMTPKVILEKLGGKRDDSH